MKKSLLALALLVLLTPFARAAQAAEYPEIFLADFDRVSKKLTDLADAVPADKFGFKPVDGVRTVSEVFMHVAAANFAGAAALGVAAPAEIGADIEQKFTSKDEVLRVLKASQENVRKALEANKGNMNVEAELFGAKRQATAIFVLLAGHSHEHLGQMIAYVRTAGITPPWSRKE